MILQFPKVYPITDARASGVSHAEQVRRLIAGGATLVQLREKHLAPRDFYHEAETALRVARERGARLIINDRVDIARALGADGVHLGQSDLPPEAARELLGPDAIIGFSTHDMDQVLSAVSLPIDYLAIGPIFKTESKWKPEPVVTLDGLRKVRAVVKNLPLVAIGGITPENAGQVLAAGADAVALISALVGEGSEIESRMRQVLDEVARASRVSTTRVSGWVP